MNSTSNPLNVYLPKWPGLVVQGEPVTHDQAAQIIVRTDRWDMCCNDRPWIQAVAQTLGATYKDRYPHVQEDMADCLKPYGILDLQYLHNEHIMSAYIGGPHGWCDWKGNIGCSGYNIGKYPSAEEVLEEWKIIAQAFPFLNLRCQLWNCEIYERDGFSETSAEPVIEYVVEQGTVSPKKPTEILEFHHPAFRMPPISFGERGCSLEQLKNALRITKEAR